MFFTKYTLFAENCFCTAKRFYIEKTFFTEKKNFFTEKNIYENVKDKRNIFLYRKCLCYK